MIKCYSRWIAEDFNLDGFASTFVVSFGELEKVETACDIVAKYAIILNILLA